MNEPRNTSLNPRGRWSRKDYTPEEIAYLKFMWENQILDLEFVAVLTQPALNENQSRTQLTPIFFLFSILLF